MDMQALETVVRTQPLADIALPAGNRATEHAVRITNDTKTGIFRFSCEDGAHKALRAFVLNYFGEDEAQLPYVVEPLNEGLQVLGDSDVLAAAANRRAIHVGNTATCMPVCVHAEDNDDDGPNTATALFRVAKAANCLDELRISISARLRCVVKEVFWGDGPIGSDAELLDAMTFFDHPHFTIASTPTMLALRASVEWFPDNERKRKREGDEPAGGLVPDARTCAGCGSTRPGIAPGARWSGTRNKRILCTSCQLKERKK